jgi:hypothetical protein
MEWIIANGNGLSNNMIINPPPRKAAQPRETMTKTQLLRKVERLFDIPDKVFFWTLAIGSAYFIIRTIIG